MVLVNCFSSSAIVLPVFLFKSDMYAVFFTLNTFENLLYAYLLTLPLCTAVSRVRALSPAWTAKGVKQINNRISFKHLYHSYLSAFSISAGVPNGEFPEILIAKCRSIFFGTLFFSQAEDFES
jgi:hypothetical protein